MGYRIILLFLLVSLYSSCAYFNTFHNTKKLYEDAAKERKKRQDDEPTAAERKLYDETITKASKILELYSGSGYVDDALFILGECFYYKGEPVKAQRKFQELITYFPNGDYYDKSRVWLAKTHVRLNDFASAKVILNELFKDEKLDKSLRQEARFLMGEIQYNQGYYEDAAHEYHEAALLEKDRFITSQSWLHLGECQLFFGNSQAAAVSFRNAMKSSPDNLQGFDARLSYARALKLTGDFKSAARLCNQLLENPVYQRKAGYVELELADIIYSEGKALNEKLKATDLQYSGKIEEALEKYDIILLQHKRTDVSAIAHYRIAKIQEEDLKDFVKAKEHYEKVKLEYAKCEFADEAETKAKNIGDLIELTNKIRQAQGGELIGDGQGGSHRLTELELLLLEHGVHPEVRFMADQRQFALEQQEKTDATQNESGLSSNDLLQMERLNELVSEKLQLAETYLFQFQQVDSALAQYNEVVALFPDHPEAAKALYSSAYIYENIYHNKFKTDSLLYVLIEYYPDTKQAKDAHRKLGLPVEDSNAPAAEMFRRAEASLFAYNDPSSAVQQYRELIQAYPTSDYAPKALYSLGWIYEEKLFDNEKAAEAYEQIKKNYPETDYFNAVNQKVAAFEKDDGPSEVAETTGPGPISDPDELLQRGKGPSIEEELTRKPEKPLSDQDLDELLKHKLPDRRPSQRKASSPQSSQRNRDR